VARKYSTGVSPEYHAELLRSPEARAERRAEKLDLLPAPLRDKMRGRTRDFVTSLDVPIPLSDEILSETGKRFQQIGGIIVNQFTGRIPVFSAQGEYLFYTMSPNRNNKREETDPYEQQQANMARQRQSQHAADKLHRNVWIEWQIAQVFGAAAARTKIDVAQGKQLDRTATYLTSAALEDFGHSLVESGKTSDIRDCDTVAQNVINTAIHGLENDEVLISQSPTLYLLVQREQERRSRHWGDLLLLYEQEDWGGNRRTRQDLEDETANMQLIEILKTNSVGIE
jgi:hypothetical protein